MDSTAIFTINSFRNRIDEYLKNKINQRNLKGEYIPSEIQLEIGKLVNLLGEIEQLRLKIQGRRLTIWQKLIDKFFINADKECEYIKIKE
ncbi:MAG TPA: hypothetical protein V6C91_01650 [Coleofasciculaceae cyanobacterium]